jgi:hypothetical protein
MPRRQVTTEAIVNQFTYHRPTPEQQAKYQLINAAACELAQLINSACPDCPDKSAAIRLVRQARMTANAAIACEPEAFHIREMLGYQND